MSLSQTETKGGESFGRTDQKPTEQESNQDSTSKRTGSTSVK